MILHKKKQKTIGGEEKWQIKYPRKEKKGREITIKEAACMAATHLALTVTTLSLDSDGVIRPADFTTITTNTTDGPEAARYLGIQVSLTAGVEAHIEKMVATVRAKARAAVEVSRNFLDLKLIGTMITGSIEFALTNIPMPMETAMKIDKDLADAGLDILGLSHYLPYANRTTAILTSSTEMGGLGLPSIIPLSANKAAKGIHRLAHHEDSTMQLNLTTSADRSLLEDGSINPEIEKLLPHLQMPQWLMLLKDLDITAHGSGDPPSNPAAKEPITLEQIQHKLFTPVEDKRLKPSLTISMAPNDEITFVPTNSGRHPTNWPIYGSASIYAAIDIALRQDNTMILIMSNKGKIIHNLYTKEGRSNAKIDEKETENHALDQTVRMDIGEETGPTQNLILGVIRMKEVTATKSNEGSKAINGNFNIKRNQTTTEVNPKTWPRNQIFDQISDTSLQFIAAKIAPITKKIMERRNAEKSPLDDTSHLNPPGNGTEEYIIVTDAGVTPIQQHEMAPDWIKETYFKMMKPRSTEEPPLESIESTHTQTKKEVSENKEVYGWLHCASGAPPQSPHSSDNEARWVLCTAKRETDTPHDRKLNRVIIKRVGVPLRTEHNSPKKTLIATRSLEKRSSMASTNQGVQEINSRDYEATRSVLEQTTWAQVVEIEEHRMTVNLDEDVCFIKAIHGHQSATQFLGETLTNPPKWEAQSLEKQNNLIKKGAEIRTSLDRSTWYQWCSRAGTNHIRLDKVLGQGPPGHPREKLLMALTIAYGMTEMKTPTWRNEGMRLTCPCFTTNLGSHSLDRTLRISRCTNLRNDRGLRGTHDQEMWRQVTSKYAQLKKAKDPTLPEDTFRHRYCLCGEPFENTRAREIHALTAQDGNVHGTFFDEIPKIGGAFGVIKRDTREVVAAGAMRIHSQTTKTPDSTAAEFITHIIAEIWATTESASPPLAQASSVLRVIDSLSTAQTIKAAVDETPKLTEEFNRGEMGALARTLRRIRTTATNAALKHTQSHMKNEHGRDLRDETFQNFLVAAHQAIDAGATEGQKTPKDQVEDYGSRADCRADPYPVGWGPAVIYSSKGLKLGGPMTEHARKSTSALNILFLSKGEVLGSMARCIMRNEVLPDSHAILERTLNPTQYEAVARYAQWQYTASGYRVARSTGKPQSNIFLDALTHTGNKKETCLLCDGDFKDNMRHALTGECTDLQTQAALRTIELTISEALARSGSCSRPERWYRPPPRLGREGLDPSATSLKGRIHNAYGDITWELIDMSKARDLLEKGMLSANHHKRLQDFVTNRERSDGRTHYQWAKGRLEGRKYAPRGAQLLPSDVRAAVGDTYFDLDFDCSHPSVIIDLLRKKGIEIPEIIYKMVSKRTEFREEAAKYYDMPEGQPPKAGIKFIKGVINAMLYGQSPNSTEPFVNAGIPLIEGKAPAHHPDILSFSTAINEVVTKLVPLDGPDYTAAKLRKLAKDPHKEPSIHDCRFSGLSDLTCRIESQKLQCILHRLTHWWGINPTSIILMHDGAMVSMRNRNPKGQAAAQGKTSIDEEVLKDLTLYTRTNLGVFIRMSVKSGSNTTDIACGVPWPPLEDPSQGTETVEAIDQKSGNKVTTYPPLLPAQTLGTPKIFPDRPTSPTDGIHFEGGRTISINTTNDGTGPTRWNINTERAQTLIDCYRGEEREFGLRTQQILQKFLAPPPEDGMLPAIWCIALPHARLLENLRDIYSIEACICTPTCIPTNTGGTPMNPMRLSHLFNHTIFPYQKNHKAHEEEWVAGLMSLNDQTPLEHPTFVGLHAKGAHMTPK